MKNIFIQVTDQQQKKLREIAEAEGIPLKSSRVLLEMYLMGKNYSAGQKLPPLSRAAQNRVKQVFQPAKKKVSKHDITTADEQIPTYRHYA
jgi:hypothetical protein